MSLINRLISEAKKNPQPRELRIRPQDVRKVAIHCQSVTLICMGSPSIEEIEAWMIRGGVLKMIGVPIRVLGTRA